MSGSIYSIPVGMRDIVDGECELRVGVERRLCERLGMCGYRRVMTPALEYYELFRTCRSSVSEENCYKLTGRDGRIITLRPDSTVPAGRLAATRMRDRVLPLRLYYDQSVFRMNPRSGRAEYTQCGVELAGAAGLKADLEVIMTAVGALKACGLDGFKVEIGHSGIFRALSAEAGLDADEHEQARNLIESKNYATLNDLLASFEERDPEKLRPIAGLPSLFGGGEVFTAAEKSLSGKLVSQPLNYLKELYSELVSAGLGDSVIIDLGLVQDMDYYSGVTFKGYVGGFGSSILSGGRYDGLYDAFGLELPAVGFAIDVDAVCDALYGTVSVDENAPQLIIYYTSGCAGAAYEALDKQTSEGVSCEMALGGTEESALELAAQRGAGRVLFVTGNGLRYQEV